MKSSDFFRVQSNRIYFMQSGRDYSINVMKRTEVLIRPVLKKAGATVANAVANSMTNSIANGNEQVHIIVRIHLLRGYEDILMNEQVLISSGLLRNGRACPQASKKAEAVSCVSLYNITAVIELFSEYTNIRTAYI